MDDTVAPASAPGADSPLGPDVALAAEPPEQVRALSSQAYRALADEDWTAAVDLIEANWGLMASYRLDVVRAVADALPDELVVERPRWATVRRFVSHILMSAATRPPMYVRSGILSTRGTPLDDFTNVIEGSIAARSRGDNDAVWRFVDDAVRIARTQDLGILPGGRMLPTLLHQLGLSAELAGREEVALDAFQRAYARSSATGDLRAAVNAAAESALLHTLAGRREAASAWLDRHRLLTAVSPDLDRLRSTVHLADASRMFDALHFDEAREVLEKTHTDAWPEHWTSVAAHRVLFDAYAGRTDTWALLSRLDSVAMEHASTASGMSFNQYLLDYVRCTVLTFGGQFERAIAIINEADDFTGRRQSLAQRSLLRYLLGDFDDAARDADGVLAAMRRWPRGVVKALLVRAGVEWRHGNQGGAADFYRQAIAIGLENQLLLSFAAIPHEDSLAIAALAFPEGAPDGLQQVLDVPHLFVPPVTVVEKLTPQEQRVLTELATGRTVVQAAARLGISENTAKVHARAIYRKLNVGSRAEVLAEASRRGLI